MSYDYSQALCVMKFLSLPETVRRNRLRQWTAARAWPAFTPAEFDARLETYPKKHVKTAEAVRLLLAGSGIPPVLPLSWLHPEPEPAPANI